MSSKLHHDIIRGIAGFGPLLFFTIATVEGFLREGYDPIAQPISALALGPRGWIQGINFFVLATAFFAMATALRRELRGGVSALAAPAVFGIMAIGVSLAGIFPMDALGAAPTLTGKLHMRAGFLVFPFIPVAILLVARRFRREPHWRSYHGYTLATGILCLATITFFLAFVGPPGQPRPWPGLVGLVQRVMLLPFFVWIAAVVHRMRGVRSAFARRSSSACGASPGPSSSRCSRIRT